MQQEENRPPTRIKINRNEDKTLGPENNYRKDGSKRIKHPDGASNDLLKSVKKRRWTN